MARKRPATAVTVRGFGRLVGVDMAEHSAAELTRLFWASVDKRTPGECWNWCAGMMPTGYGSLVGKYRVHRYSYELHHGTIPDGMLVDHTCHNRRCVNPAHLRLATNKQNMENLAGLSANNTTGFRGVCRHKPSGRFIAYVSHYGKRVYLGYFPTAAAAGEVARKARLALFTHNELDRAGA